MISDITCLQGFRSLLLKSDAACSNYSFITNYLHVTQRGAIASDDCTHPITEVY